ncbi:nuclear transport factor 2 family protein [Xanthomonas sp. 4461]|uniref:Nuclear transport factor 2 family protein n=1 Tax=Xanthomonas sp. 10-10 TaxID=3115848 RepID=A0AAU7PDK0_9XANT|nr:nuclear transport factor 2 family protein [Xanthomonas sp. 4461]MCS3811005.1 putative SnoaL-like aldol condensation-catalyzing enzyme [Xanthomonas sp. 4461]
MNEKNKLIATRAYQRIFGDLDESAMDDCMTPNFIQHNPTIGDGPDGVKALVRRLISQGVRKQKIQFKHVLSEDDVVILHSRYEMEGKEWRFIDIYRFEGDRFAEHWDGMMQMPDVRANSNGLF